MAYTPIHDSWWLNSRVRNLSATEKLVLLYLKTNPRKNLAGLYYLPQESIPVATGLSQKTVNAAMVHLEELDFVALDKSTSIIWVKDLLLEQSKAAKEAKLSPTQITGVVNQLKELEDTSLIAKYLSVYADLGILIPYQYPVDSLPNEEKEKPKNKNKNNAPLSPPKEGAGGGRLDLSKMKGSESLIPPSWTDELMQAWNDYCPPELPQVTVGKVDRRRRRAIAIAYKHNPELNWWRWLFAALGQYELYIGLAEGTYWRGATFNWTLKNAQQIHERILCDGGYEELEAQQRREEEKARERKEERLHAKAIAKFNSYTIKHGGIPIQQITYGGTYSCRNCFDSGYEGEKYKPWVQPCLKCDAYKRNTSESRLP